ncbi:MAG: Fic family protein [Coxiellaceae bacterium]|nr:Fic family protein [Coxiellaceae bacterium]
MREKSKSSSKQQFALNQIAYILQSGETWRYFVDGPHQLSGRHSYTENGYLCALMNCFTRLADFAGKERLTVGDLGELHRLSVEGVSGTAYDADTAFGAYRCRAMNSTMTFGLYSFNSSKAGYIDLINKIRDGSFGGQFLLRPSPNEGFYSIGNDFLHSKTDVEIDDIAEKLMTKFHAVLLQMPPVKVDIELAVNLQLLLDRYYIEIESADTEVEKLTAIARFCQDAARLHPYRDGNGRVFCMLAPYLLCMQNGMMPPMMDDVNVFGNYSIEEIVAAMKLGIKRSQSIRSGKPFMSPIDRDQHLQVISELETYEHDADRCLDSLALNPWQQVLLAVRRDELKETPELKKYYRSLSVTAKARLSREISKHYAAKSYAALFDEDDAKLQLLSSAVQDNPENIALLVATVRECYDDAEAILAQAQYEAACYGNIAFLVELRQVCKGPHVDINARASNGQTALHGAIRNNQWELASMLLGQGANPHLWVGRFTTFNYALNHHNTSLVINMLKAYGHNAQAYPLGRTRCIDPEYLQRIAVDFLKDVESVALTKGIVCVLNDYYPLSEVLDALAEKLASDMTIPDPLPELKQSLALLSVLPDEMRGIKKIPFFIRGFDRPTQLSLLDMCLTSSDSGLKSQDILQLFRSVFFDSVRTVDQSTLKIFLEKLPDAKGLTDEHRQTLLDESEAHLANMKLNPCRLPQPLDPRFFVGLFPADGGVPLLDECPGQDDGAGKSSVKCD